VVQDTWLAALEHLDGFEGRATLRTWLLHVVANKARTRLAREGRTVPFSALGAAGDGEEPAEDPARFAEDGHWRQPVRGWSEEDPERLALGAETRAILEAAIAALPEAQRAVLTLRDVEGLETEEICNLLGVTVSNQRVLLHRARARVRLALEQHMAGAR
jgi:RNA polymerase sigma-70 factor (ECF subfamily)